MPLIFLESFSAPAMVLNIAGQEITMPATAEKVWKACKNLKKSNAKAA